MAEFASWGPQASGERLAELDRAKLSLENMQALHSAGQALMVPSQIAAHTAQANLHGIEAAGKLDALAANRVWDAGVRTLDAGAMSPEEYLSKVGIMGIQAGAPEAGRKLVDTASNISLHKATERLDAARGAEQEALAIKNKAEMIGALAGTVTDQASLDRARLIAQNRGMDVSQIPTEYNAQTAPLINQIRDSSMSAAKRADLQLKSIEEDRRLELASSRLQTDTVRRQLIEAQEQLATARRERLEKDGGKKGVAAASPTKSETDQAKRVFKEAGMELEGGDLEKRAFDVAARAKALVKSNPGLDTAQAMRRSLAEFQQQGGFESAKGFFGGTSTKAVNSGRGPLTALPMPTKAEELKPDTYYITPKGPLKWVKQGGKYGFLKEE